jgi:serine/threonine protein kinase
MKQLRPGDILDNFTIISHLQQSSVANIYTARDVVYQDLVVLKIPLDTVLYRPILIYHHQNEENLSNLLNHPNIVRYLKRPQTHQYLILEYIKGQSLRKRIDDDVALSFQETLQICRQAAAAINYLHTHRIIHFDIKPENILISESGSVKIIDFGIARQIGTEDVLGRDFREPQGTPYYISPEQLCGKRSCYQSDIYSLGIVVYEMLTGKLPYTKSLDLNEIRERLIKPPIPPRHHNPDIPPAVEEIILKALATEPDQRYRTAPDFVDALADYQTGPVRKNESVNTGATSLFSIEQSSHHLSSTENIPFLSNPSQQKNRILGCIANHDNFQMIIDHIRREALLTGAEITLLHVLEEDSSDYISHSKIVEQQELSDRLDNSISTFRQFGLTPVVRLKTGKPAEVIVETARELSACLIVLGPPRPRKFFSRLLHGSVIEKVAGAGVANLAVASTVSSPMLPLLREDEAITLQYVNDLELYLWDFWVNHLNSALIEIPQALAGAIEMPRPHPLQSCPFNQLLDSMPGSRLNEALHKRIENCHCEFHVALDLMAENTGQGNHDTVRNIYKDRAIPLSLELKRLLKNLLVHIRSSPSLSHISFMESDGAWPGS